MSALCQKQTFRLHLDIIVGGQGCSSSWSITRETSPPAISAPGRGRYAASDLLAHCNGVNLSVAAGAPDRRFCRWRRIRRRRTRDGAVAFGKAGPAVRHRKPPWCKHERSDRVVVRAPADGYTLLLVGLASAINATL